MIFVAALIQQVDDQLELVQTFVVRDLGLVAGLDERVEARLHERGNAAAEHGLLAEEVALRLFRERRLEEPYATAADADAVGERELERPSGGVHLHGDEARRAGARHVELADAMPRRLRRDHDHVVVGGRRDPAEVDVEPVREEHGGPRREVRRDLRLPYALLDVIRHEQRHDLRAGDGVRDRRRLETGLLHGRPGRAPVAQADAHVDARVVEVQCVCMSLAAEADDGDPAVEKGEIAVAVDGCHAVGLLSRG